MSEEKCKKCGKESEYPMDWYYDEHNDKEIKMVCPHCSWEKK